MRNRKATLVHQEVLDPSGTRIFNLDFSNPIVALYIGVIGRWFDNSDTNNCLLPRNISKIEVVDGSDVIFSMNMEDALAVSLYHSKEMPFETSCAGSYMDSIAQLKISFGRDDSDNEWMLDPKRFVNLQLKITYAFTESAAYWAANTQKLTVRALVCENPAQDAAGFLMTKNVYSWNKASSGDETIDLPRDYPVRMMVVRAKDSNTPTWAEFTNVKISCDTDRFVPLDEYLEDISQENLIKYGMKRFQGICHGDGSDTAIKGYHPFAWNYGARTESWNFGAISEIARPYSGYSTFVKDSTPTALTNAQRCIHTHQGWNYYGTEGILFGNLKDPQEFFDPTPFQSVRAILTQAQTAAAPSAIILQQLRNY